MAVPPRHVPARVLADNCAPGHVAGGPGRYLGVSERTAYRYAKGEADIPAAQVLLLRALVALNIKPLVPRWTQMIPQLAGPQAALVGGLVTTDAPA